MKHMKRILAMLLTVLLLVSVVPIALAEEIPVGKIPFETLIRFVNPQTQAVPYFSFPGSVITQPGGVPVFDVSTGTFDPYKKSFPSDGWTMIPTREEDCTLGSTIELLRVLAPEGSSFVGWKRVLDSNSYGDETDESVYVDSYVIQDDHDIGCYINFEAVYADYDGPTSGQCGDHVYWDYEKEANTLIISGSGDMWDTDVVDADHLPTYYSCANDVQKIVVKQGVRSIGECAFVGFPVKTVDLASSVSSIGAAAFSNDMLLTNIMVGYLDSIGDNAFEYCVSLRQLPILYDSHYFGHNAILGCSSLTEFTVPECMTEIGIEEFYKCSALTSIIVPENITKIDVGAFFECDSLRDIYIENPTCEIVDAYDFDGDGIAEEDAMGLSVAQYTIPQHVTLHGLENSTTQVFAERHQYNFEIYNVTQGKCGDHLRWGFVENKLFIEGFGDMWNYTVNTAPWSSYKEDITTVLGIAVQSIGNNAFSDLSSLSNVFLPDAETIGTGAFRNCRSLESIMLTHAVASIGEEAFAGCTALKTITLSSDLTSLGLRAFAGCSGLESIFVFHPNCQIADDVETIPETAVIYGYDNSTAQAYAEKYNRTFVLLNEENSLESTGRCGDNLIWTLDKNKTLIISGTGDMWNRYDDSLDEETREYRDNQFWSNAGSGWMLYNGDLSKGCEIAAVIIEEGVTSVGQRAFFGMDLMRSILLPDTLTKIGDSAFEGCERVKEIFVPKNLVDIDFGLSPFVTCYGLEKITVDPENPVFSSDENGCLYWQIPKTFFEENEEWESEIQIPEGASEGASMLALLQYPASRTATILSVLEGTGIILPFAVSNSSLESVSLPDSVWWIAPMAFARGSELREISLGNGVIAMDYRAFIECHNLTTITLPESVQIIDSSFHGCDGLEAVYFMNPNCKIMEESVYTDDSGEEIHNSYEDNGLPEGIIIYGYEGSTAQAFAQKYDRIFVSLGEYHQHTYTAEIVKNPTCKTTGTIRYTCTCGDSYDETIPVLEHNYITETVESDCQTHGYTRTYCTVGGEEIRRQDFPTTEHKFGDWKVVKEATQDEEGMETRTCSICGAKDNRAINKLPKPADDSGKRMNFFQRFIQWIRTILHRLFGR